MAKGPDWNDEHRTNPGAIRDAMIEPDILFDDPQEGQKYRGNGHDGSPLEPTGTSSRRKMQIEWFTEAATSALNEPANELIEDLLDEGALSVVYGESASGKTFILLDPAYCVSLGAAWNGKTAKHGLVVYVAAEGGNKIKRRLAALALKKGRDANELEPLFALIRYPIDLRSSDANLNELVAVIKDAEKAKKAKCIWVIVDTLSRALAGGDENSSVDMGRIVNAADRIREATGAHFTYVHHSGKDTLKGARGHSLLRAATDTEIEVTPNKVHATKQRDRDCNFAMSFDLVDVPLGTSSNGKPIKSAIVEWWPSTATERKQGQSAPASLRLLMDVIKAALDEVGKQIRPLHDGPIVTAAQNKAVRSRFYARTAERAEDGEDPEKLAERRRRNFNNAMTAAINRKAIMAAELNGERWIWLP